MRKFGGGSAHSPAKFTLYLLVGLAAPTASLQAQDWEPPPPMPDNFDWVQLNSGEWLKGEIRVMYNDSLEFDSEELDKLSLDLEDIREIRSAQIISLRARSGQTATGQLLLDGDSVKVFDGEEVNFTRAEILTITAGVPRERNYWAGDVVVQGTYRAGNTDQTDTGVDISFQRRTILSRMIMDFRSNYTETNDVLTVDTRAANLSWDRFRSAKLFTRPVFVEYFRDPFQNIASRYTIGPAAGWQIRDTSRTDWSVFVGPAYTQTTFSQVAPGEPADESTWALSSGMAFEIAVTSRIDIIADYRFQLTSKEAGRYNHQMTTSFKLELTASLDFDISAYWNRVAEPKPNADGSIPLQNDYRLAFGVGYEF